MTSAVPAKKICDNLLEECYCRSLDLLRLNTSRDGILASSCTDRAACRHYTSIFGRDAAICALGMIASGQQDLIEGARAGLLTLARHQAANGQIPKYVKPGSNEVDFWYLGCIDATLWWLIALSFHDRLRPGQPLQSQLEIPVRRALRWLSCQEHQQWGLLQQNEASDWADIMPRSGFVLYTNALWYRVKRLYGLAGADRTRECANQLLAPFCNREGEHRRLRLLTRYIRQGAEHPPELFLSFVNFSFWGQEIDLFGNVLASLFELPHAAHRTEIARAILTRQADSPFPLRVVERPLEPDDGLWRTYMQRHEQNYPYQYHNGGIWPFAGGFWVLFLNQMGLRNEAWAELEKLAVANQANDWEFNEWFHGRTASPMGMPGQSWNGALFVLAFHALCDGLSA